MRTYKVQLLKELIGVYAGNRGDILEVPAAAARSMALAGMAIICGDEPEEVIDPETVEIPPEPPPAPPAAADDPHDEPLETGEAADTDGEPPLSQVKVTPAAWKMAIGAGIDPATIPTQRIGKCTRSDVRRFLESKAKAEGGA